MMNNIKALFLIFLFSGCIKHFVVKDNDTKKTIFEGYYFKLLKDSIPVGMWKEYYLDSGIRYLSVKEKVAFDSSGRVIYSGKKITYYKNGKIKDISYYDGCRIYGTYKYYYPNGSPSYRKMYVNNKEYGSFLKYNTNGVLIEKGNLCGYGKTIFSYDTLKKNIDSLDNIYPIRCGLWMEFHENGKIKGTGEYENYVIINKEFYQQNLSDDMFENDSIIINIYHKKGTWKYYSDDSKKIWQTYYSFGVPYKTDTISSR